MPAVSPTPGDTSRVMHDSITARNIPASAQMVAGYVDGAYVWSAADWGRFPNATKVRIAVFASTNDGHVLDVERGNATPEEAPGWVLRRRAAGVDPSVYCSESAWPIVRAAFAAAHVPEPHWWIAAYPGIGATVYPGAVAHQYADLGPYDLSVVADCWPGVDAATTTTKPAASALTEEEKAMADLSNAEILIGKDKDGKPVYWDFAHVVGNLRAANGETQKMIGNLANVVAALAKKSGVDLAEIQSDLDAIRADLEQPATGSDSPSAV